MNRYVCCYVVLQRVENAVHSTAHGEWDKAAVLMLVSYVSSVTHKSIRHAYDCYTAAAGAAGERSEHTSFDTFDTQICNISSSTCVASPTKKKEADSADKATTGSTSTSVFSCWAFFNSAVTPAVGSIRKCPTRLRTLWCTPCSVAKRRQFSCPLRAWTLPLKFENVVP